MTIRPITQGSTSAKVLQFPDPPREEMTAFHHVGVPRLSCIPSPALPEYDDHYHHQRGRGRTQAYRGL